VCNLHRWRSGIPVNGNRLDAETLSFDHYFFAELPRAEQQYPSSLGC
jgi:hypothetical protein